MSSCAGTHLPACPMKPAASANFASLLASRWGALRSRTTEYSTSSQRLLSFSADSVSYSRCSSNVIRKPSCPVRDQGRRCTSILSIIFSHYDSFNVGIRSRANTETPRRWHPQQEGLNDSLSLRFMSLFHRPVVLLFSNAL